MAAVVQLLESLVSVKTLASLKKNLGRTRSQELLLRNVTLLSIYLLAFFIRLVGALARPAVIDLFPILRKKLLRPWKPQLQK
jgi:hypothetical protein